MSNNVIGIADFSNGTFDRTTEAGSGLSINPISVGLYPGNGIWRSEVIDLAEDGVDTLDSIVFNSDASTQSGTSVVMRTRTGAIASVDGTWEEFLPVNEQVVVDHLNDYTTFGSGANITLSGLVESGTGIHLSCDAVAIGEIIEKELSPALNLSAYDYVSFDTRSTHSGTNIQLQLASYNNSGAGVPPNVFDTYLLSGNDGFEDVYAKQYWDLSDVVSGSALDLSSVNYVAFKVMSGIDGFGVDLTQLFGGNYLESGTNSIESTPQRYIQHETILTSLRS